MITGAASGIGRALADGMAAAGAAVVAVDVDGPAAAETAAAIATKGGEVLALTADVRQPEQVEAAVGNTIRQYGTIDVLINNVGGNVGQDCPPERLSLTDWSQTLELTVTTAFLCSQYAGRHMTRKGGGKIINIASIYGLIAHDSTVYDPAPEGETPEQIAYITAKGAVIAFTRGLAAYWARHGILVNAIAPGAVKTPANDHRSPDHWKRLAQRTPLGRVATPKDLVGSAIFLASPASSHMTGQVLIIDGGWSIV